MSSLLLSKEEIYRRIIKINYKIDRKELLVRYQNSQNIFQNILKIILKINPDLVDSHILASIIWQIGHVIYFYANLIISNLPKKTKLSFIKDNQNTKKLIEFYDSFLTPPSIRNNIDIMLNLSEAISRNAEVYHLLIKYIRENEMNSVNSYLLMLGLLHQEMHLEAFIFEFLKNKIKIDFVLFYPFMIEKEKLVSGIEWINYESGKFIQGSTEKICKTHLTFDNEKPIFSTNVSNFQISKYPITESQYLEFILDRGYQNAKYWCLISWTWKEKDNIELPLYWYQENNKYYKKINGVISSVNTNLPICHISYYEAKAYCRWKNVRLPTEKEYEFVATNRGKDKYPWGDCDEKLKYANLNYTQYLVPVDYFQKGNNKEGVSQLIGNVWEWCEEPIYPYDGFIIDPVYREMSYPFFGEKKICKGGCWAVSDFLIHPRYRNAQLPTCRQQFIGFRVCQN